MKTFIEIRAYAMKIFAAIATLQADYKKTFTNLKDSGKYNASYLLNVQNEFTIKFAAEVKKAADELGEVVKATCDHKRKAIEKMLTEAPSNDQMNLLNTLKLQGKGIEPDEVKSIAAQLMGNYRAVHALRVMAEEQGIRLSFPAQYDYQQLKDTLNRAEAYLKDRVRDLSNYTDDKHMDFYSKMFFGVWEGGLLLPDNVYTPDAELLDSNEQIAPVPVVERINQSNAE